MASKAALLTLLPALVAAAPRYGGGNSRNNGDSGDQSSSSGSWPFPPEGPVEMTQQIIDRILQVHNDARTACGAPALTWDASLAKDAQGWINTCPKDDQHVHGCGENWLDTSKTADPGKMINDGWLSEIQYYDFNKPGVCPSGQMIGHYTQAVWKDTQRVGCGIKNCGNQGYTNPMMYMDCRYMPPGNIWGDQKADNYKNNVSPPKGYTPGSPNACGSGGGNETGSGDSGSSTGDTGAGGTGSGDTGSQSGNEGGSDSGEGLQGNSGEGSQGNSGEGLQGDSGENSQGNYNNGEGAGDDGTAGSPSGQPGPNSGDSGSDGTSSGSDSGQDSQGTSGGNSPGSYETGQGAGDDGTADSPNGQPGKDENGAGAQGGDGGNGYDTDSNGDGSAPSSNQNSWKQWSNFAYKRSLNIVKKAVWWL